MNKQTIEEKINDIATEYTNGTRHQSYKPILINRITILVEEAKIETIKELRKSL